MVILQVLVNNRRLRQTGGFQPSPDISCPFANLTLCRLIVLHRGHFVTPFQRFSQFGDVLNVRTAVIGFVGLDGGSSVCLRFELFRYPLGLALSGQFQLFLVQLLLQQLLVSEDGLLRYRGQIGGRIKVLELEIHHFLRLYPLAVDVVETF